MRCEGCGTELPDNAKFCHQCGRPVAGASLQDATSNVDMNDAPDVANVANNSKGTLDNTPVSDVANVVINSKDVPADALGAPAGSSTSDAQNSPDAPAEEAAEAPQGAQPQEDLAATSSLKEVEATQVRPGSPQVEVGDTVPVPTPVDATKEAVRLDLTDEDLVDSLVTDPSRPGSTGRMRVYAAPDPIAEEQAAEKNHRLGLITAAVLFVAALAMLAAFVTWRMEIWGGKTLPDTVGMDQAAATSLLEGEGFSVATTEVVSDNAVGKVVSQEPAGSRRVNPGSVVALGIGVERSVPEVEGMALEDAKEALHDRSIDHVRVEYENSDNEKGTVIAVTPSAGSVVAADEMVTLVVAQPYTVPDVVGLSEDDAKEAVERAGLTYETVMVASDQDPGTVVSADPAVGSELKANSKVTLTVSSPYPASPYAALEYLHCAPKDLSTYLRQQGYSLLYGATRDDVVAATWAGSAASPQVVIGPNPFAEYRGFQFWATDGLAAGAQIQGVRLTFDQDSAPDAAGALKVDQATVNTLMEACGLKTSSGTTTTATPQTLAPKASQAPEFIATAGTQGSDTWAIVVWRANDQVLAAVCVAPTQTLETNLSAAGISLDAYEGSMANLAATQLLIKG